MRVGEHAPRRRRDEAATYWTCPYGRCDQGATALDRKSCGSVGAGQEGIMKTTVALLVGMLLLLTEAQSAVLC